MSENQHRTSRSRKQTHARKKAPRKWLKRILLAIVGLFVAIAVIGGGLVMYYASSTPEITRSDLEGATETKILDKDQNLITELGGENRDVITASDVPQSIKDAVTSIEDRRFYTHIGIDPIRIVGSFIRNLRAGGITQGGSTITQQLVKLSVFSTKKEDQTYRRKVQEMMLALEIERQYSKEQILTYYLNKVYMANNVYGFGTAASYYYNKSLSELTLPQAAMLAGMPQAPNSYDPIAHPDAAKERRDLVLQTMLSNGKITDAQYQEAIATPITDGLITEHEQVASDDNKLIFDSFLTMVLDEVKEKSGLDPYSDGLTIETTVDSDAQNRLYNIINSNQYVQYVDENVQNAVVMLDSTTGAVRAINGGKNQTTLLAYNRATDNDRSTGSTIKPIMDYGPAIEYLNYSTGQTIVDQPTKYSSGFELNNWDNQYMGAMTMRRALVLSRNTPAYQTFKAVGNTNIQAFLKQLDLTVTNDGTESLVESNAIGANISPLKMAAAYAAFANYGTYSQPYTVTKITTRDGQVFNYEPQQHQAMKDSTAYMITDMLKDSFKYGFAEDVNTNGVPQAAKTGSTNYTPEQRRAMGASDSENIIPDSWFIGYSPEYTISVWTGYDNPYAPGSGLNITEQGYSKQIYSQLMSYVSRGTTVKDWTQPSSVESANIIVGSNPLALAGNRTGSGISTELFVRGSLPTQQQVQTQRRTVEAPSGLSASYDRVNRRLTVTWNAVTSNEGTPSYVVSVNGQSRTVSETTATFDNITGEEVTVSVQTRVGNESSEARTTQIQIGNPEQTTQEGQSTQAGNSQQPNGQNNQNTPNRQEQNQNSGANLPPLNPRSEETPQNNQENNSGQ